MRVNLTSLILPLALLASACGPFWGFVHDEHLAGPYRLVATDSDEQMSLCRSAPNGGGDCFGDGLPGQTIFAAGADERYIVVGRHPHDFITGNSPPGATTEFYYVIRTPDEAERGPYGHVRGPFTEQQFENEKRRLNLPEFTRVFGHLKR